MKRALQVTMILFVLFGLRVTSHAQDFENNWGIGLYGAAHKLIGGNADDAMVSGWGGLNFLYGFSDKLNVSANVAGGWTFARDPDNQFQQTTKRPYKYFRTWLFPMSLNLSYLFLPEGGFRPYATAGAGVTIWQLRYERWTRDLFSPSGWVVPSTQYNATGSVGLGAIIPLSEHFLFDLSGHYHYLYDQNKDNVGTGYVGYTANNQSFGGIRKEEEGDVNDGILEFRIGLTVLFGGPKDSDQDGILNRTDKCPNQAEDIDGFMDDDGCPDLDNDKDGIIDAEDQCPNQPEDIDGFQDDDGCPDVDNDADGIPDTEDECPGLTEDFDGFEDEDGCPDLDNDADGIPDTEDECPNEPENFNEYQDVDGCPDEPPAEEAKEEPVVKKGEKFTFPKITFQSGSANLTAKSKLILDNVYQMLRDHSEMKIEIRGYTDSIGKAEFNYQLSEKRANAVKQYLQKKGIEAGRMFAIGFGEEKPIADNATPEGREKNRRIEFVRIE